MEVYHYLICPFLAWFCAGCLKFLINSIQQKRLAFALIGYGGMPSNHSAIVASTAVLIALKQGIQDPAFAVALSLVFIVTLDANSLRRAVGKHAMAINKLTAHDCQQAPLRERMGHSKIEICAGIAVGTAVAWVINGLSFS